MVFRYSAINQAYRCLKAYEKSYLLGHKPDEDSIDMAFGTAVHAGIAGHFEGASAIDTFAMTWGLSANQDFAKARYSFGELMEIGQNLLSKWERLHAHHYEPIHVEERLKFNIGQFKIEGTPDFVGNYKGVLSVVDWKTSGSDYDKRMPNVDEQLWIYVEACRQVYGLDIKQIVYAPFVKYGPKVQTPIVMQVTNEKLKKQIDNVKLMLEDLSTRAVFPMNKGQCLRCSFYSQCYKENA